MKPVRIAVKIMNGHSLMRSASVPETIEAAVATNTIWKYQSEPAEYPVPMGSESSALQKNLNGARTPPSATP